MKNDSAATNKIDRRTAALYIIAAITLIPVALALFLSFKDFTPIKGIFGSPWRGLAGYRNLLTSRVFYSVIRNSFVLWALGAAASFALGYLAARMAANVKNLRMAAVLAGAYLLPLFIPMAALTMLTRSILGTQAFKSESAYPVIHMLLSTARIAPLVAFSGSAMSLFYRLRGKNASKGALYGCIAAILLFSFQAFSAQKEITLLTYNEAIYMVSDTLTSFITRQGLTSSYSDQMAVFVIRSLLQAILAIAPAIFYKRLMDGRLAADLGEPARYGAASGGGKAPAIWRNAALIALAAAVLLLLIQRIGDASVPAVLPGLISTALSCAAAMGVAYLFLRAAKAPSARLAACMFLLLVFNDPFFSGFLIIRGIGAYNTVFALPLVLWKSPEILMLLVVLTLTFRHSVKGRGLLMLAGSAACLAGSAAMGSAFPATYYLSDRAKFTPGILLRERLFFSAEGQGWMFFAGVALACAALAFLCAYLAYRALILEIEEKAPG